MDFLELVKRRQSTRAYDTERAIEAEKIEQILEAGRLSPSACNAQPWHFIVVDEPELKDKIADATSAKMLGINHFTKQAPVHILIIEERPNFSSRIGSVLKEKHFAYLDIGIAAAHMCLAAENEGLGTCMLGWFDEAKIRKLLDIPKSKRVLLDITVGYPAQPIREKRRKSMEEVVTYNKYKK